MSYCVNCGVELVPGAKACPLCGTPAWRPDPAAPPYFPTKRTEVPPAAKGAAAALVSAMLGSAALCCGVLNLFLRAARPWSLYVIGAAALLWVFFVLPMLARKMPAFLSLTLDVIAVGGYVLFIAADLNGLDWFRGLALPILAEACVLVFLLAFLLRGRRRSILTALTLIIGALGLFALGIGAALDLYLIGSWKPGWSLLVLVIAVGLMIPLIVIRRVPALREEVRRRFDL